MMFGAMWATQIDGLWTNTSANVPNEYNTFTEEVTGMIVAREENLREECGSQYIVSTASQAIHQHYEKTS